MSDSVRRESFTVRHGEAGRFGSLRIDAFFDYMQEAAANHAASFSAGMSDLAAKGLIWVLSKHKMRIESFPRIGDTVEVETWPGRVNRMLATREFRLFDAHTDRTFAEASSIWLVVDTARMRPVRIEPALAPLKIPENPDRTPFFPELGKIPFSEPLSFPMETRVPESFIDVNRHMNNARYAAQVFNWLAERVENPEIRELQINFIGGSLHGDLLTTSGLLRDRRFILKCECGSSVRFEAEGLLA